MWMLWMGLAVAEPVNRLPKTLPPCEKSAAIDGIGAITIIGERTGSEVCKPKLVRLGDEEFSIEDGLNAFLETPSSAQKSAWIENVLLAFGHIEGVIDTQKSTSKLIAVELDEERRFHAARSDWTVQWTSGVPKIDRSPISSWRMAFFTKSRSVEGAEPKQVQALLNQQGGWYYKCVRDHIHGDPRREDYARVKFIVDAGKAQQLTATSRSDRTLQQCYANALANTPFPKEMKAKVEWSFVVKQASPK